MSMQNSTSAMARNQFKADAIPSRVSVGQPGNGKATGNKGGGIPNPGGKGFTASVKSGFVK